jgi:hypothetical protein
VFLYQEISDEGGAITYHVVDGKQRIETILAFIANELPVPESLGSVAGRYFKDLPPETKQDIWRYPLGVHELGETSEGYLREVFDRLNRNVGRLTRQELRHARWSGRLISLCEDVALSLIPGFPNISTTQVNAWEMSSMHRTSSYTSTRV